MGKKEGREKRERERESANDVYHANADGCGHVVATVTADQYHVKETT